MGRRRYSQNNSDEGMASFFAFVFAALGGVLMNKWFAGLSGSESIGLGIGWVSFFIFFGLLAWLFNLPASSSSTTGGAYSGGGSPSGRRASYSSGTGSPSYTLPLVSHAEMYNALKTLEAKGVGWGTLVNDKTAEERIQIFSKHFGSEEKGKFANDKFEQEQASPARKRTLNDLINKCEYEDDSIKENLLDGVKSCEGTMSNEQFQKIAKQIKSFQEQKRKIDAHTKYEGRLSNSDIKAIKTHHGYVCMGCGLDPAEQYGNNMAGIIEAHHKNPYSEMAEGEVRTAEPDDFIILCPTCHRLIHRLSNPDDLDGLKELLSQKKSSWWG